VLLGLGGFTTLPAALAARSLGIPIVLLEINAAPGQATRVLARLASRVLHAWRGTLPAGGEDERHRVTGAPVAPAVLAARHEERDERAARLALGMDPERPLLLVLGGSQGAGSLNTFVREHAAGWISAGLQVLHQCGPGRRAELGPERAGLRVEEYLAPISSALRAARLVLCRGGASTLAELAAAHVPAWVAPYPHHPDRHQERNALELGAGVRIVQDEELDEERAAELAELLGPSGQTRRAEMRAALKALAPADAALQILRELECLSSTKP
jgi:UDP-N-acetylglucosamine--N-acetylmuramyl-(pentapeptide) pyrophosphoryl-undecaprenol N-acetylglucosamine transferase